MDIIYDACAGLDVHKESVSACVRRLDTSGQSVTEVREFRTVTVGILQLGDWMESHKVRHVAMESTGVYWKPIWNLLEGRFELMLCNARDVKNVPGRKTDTRDCQWIAQLLQHGLLNPSFVPPKPHRELRDLTRHRAQLTGERTRVANRIAKTLEDANIKLSSVASDILGKSGRLMIQAIISGENSPEMLADLAQRRLRAKIPALKLALRGGVAEHHRFMLQQLYSHLQYIENSIALFEQRIDFQLRAEELNAVPKENDALPFDQAATLLTSIPGIDTCVAQAVVAEIGTNMKQFPTSGHLASWAGVCPGNNESAGKRRSGRTTEGNRWLKRVLTQAAWAASHTRESYLAEHYRRIARRRGKKRALTALSHTLLTIIYAMLERKVPYEDLGPNFFDTIAPESRVRYYKKQLEKLGYEVTLEEKQHAA